MISLTNATLVIIPKTIFKQVQHNVSYSHEEEVISKLASIWTSTDRLQLTAPNYRAYINRNGILKFQSGTSVSQRALRGSIDAPGSGRSPWITKRRFRQKIISILGRLIAQHSDFIYH